MKNGFQLRLVDVKDAKALLEIYAYYVQHTIISFEYEVPTLADFSERINSAINEFPWLVVLLEDKIIGYAYAHKHRFRSAYQWSPESSVYMAKDFQSKGVGSVLYKTLFAILELQGYFNVYAGVGLPNEKSVSFHRAMGFEEIGVFKKIGYKHGAWHDTHWFQLQLRAHIIDPPVPTIISEIQPSDTFQKIMNNAYQELMNNKLIK